MERGASRLLAFAATLSVSLLAAVALTLVSGWGGDDLGAFVFWTIPFAAAVALASPLLRGRWIARFAPVLGALAGTAWTMVVALLIGPFFGAFGFSVWIAWMAGGAAGVTLVVVRSPRVLRATRIVSYGTIGSLVLLLAVTWLLAQFLWGPDLVAHVRSGTPDAQATELAYRLLDRPGVSSVTQNDPLVLEIDLADDVTDDERRRVRAWLERLPLVDRVEG